MAQDMMGECWGWIHRYTRSAAGLQNWHAPALLLSAWQACLDRTDKLLRKGILCPAGVLSGEKQRIERAYNFIEICEWFAARCDLILLLFDPYKLDISDEFRAVSGDRGGCGFENNNKAMATASSSTISPIELPLIPIKALARRPTDRACRKGAA